MFRNFILLVTTVFTFHSAWATADKMLIVETSNDGDFVTIPFSTYFAGAKVRSPWQMQNTSKMGWLRYN